jgi:DNA-binding transcriptional LysR family regulator
MLSVMELRQMRFAVAVAEDRHFGRAAERMFIAQPALSQHVRRLEQELGARLFDRGARHVRLTPAGEAFLEVARRILRQADDAVAAARRAEAGETGSVSLGASLPVAAPALSLLLRRWATARPGVRPTLAAGTRRELVDLVRRRELDVALVEEPPVDGELRAVAVADEPIVVLLPTHHGLVRADTIEVADLADTPFVTVSRTTSPPLHGRFFGMCAAAGVTPRVALEVDDVDLLPVAVAAGLGIALVPRSLATATTEAASTTWRPLGVDAAVGAVTLSAVAVAEGATPQARELLELAGRLRHHGGLRTVRDRLLELAGPPIARVAS